MVFAQVFVLKGRRHFGSPHLDCAPGRVYLLQVSRQAAKMEEIAEAGGLDGGGGIGAVPSSPHFFLERLRQGWCPRLVVGTRVVLAFIQAGGVFLR